MNNGQMCAMLATSRWRRSIIMKFKSLGWSVPLPPFLSNFHSHKTLQQLIQQSAGTRFTHQIGIACKGNTFYIQHVIDLIQRVPIFAGLEDYALRLLLEHTEKREFEKDAIIACEGETCNKLFIIGSGSVCLFKNFGKANQVALATLSTKDFFGESCILDTLPRMATVQAFSPTTVFTISSMAFHHLYQKMPAQHSILLLNIGRDLSRRIRALDEIFAARH